MIACLVVPYFAAAVERRHDEALRPQPLAIGGQPWEARPVYAFSQEVAHRGVEIGMSLRAVQMLSPQSHFMPAAKNRYSSANSEVIDVLLDFSALIEPQEWWHPPRKARQPLPAAARALPAHFYLDLEGLPPREALPFVQEMGRAVRRETQLTPAIGLAAHKFTAQVAATVCRPERVLPVEAEDEADFLAGRSLNFLPLESDMAQRLTLLGIKTLGQLAALPLPALREQFGPDILSLYRLAQGQDETRVAGQGVEQAEAVELIFDGAVSDGQMLAAAAARLARDLAQRLQVSALHGRALALLLEFEDGSTEAHAVTLRHPTAEAAHLATAATELWQSAAPGRPVSRLRLRLTDLSPAQARQLTLFEQAAVPPQAQRTLRNLLIKYRQCAFFRPQSVDITHPLLERRFNLQPLTHDAFVG